MHSNKEMRKERKAQKNGVKYVAKEGKNSQILSSIEHPTSKIRQGNIRQGKKKIPGSTP